MKIIAKLLIVAVAAFALTLTASAQKPNLSNDCIKYMSYYQQDYKAKDYDRALPSWRAALSACPPNASQNLYIHGTTMMTRRLKEIKDPALREQVVDTILMLQDLRAENYPAKRVDILNNKGTYLVNYRKNRPGEIVVPLAEITRELGGKTNNTILVNLFSSSVALLNEGKVTPDAVADTYELVSDAMDAKRSTDPAEIEDNNKARSVVGQMLSDSGLATCERLVESYTPRFNADPNNATLAAGIIRMMNLTEDCAGTDLYFRAVTTLHRLDPSHRSAYALYRMNAAKGNKDEALEYLKEASEAADAPSEQRAGYLYELALNCYKNHQRAAAIDAALKAAETDSSYEGRTNIVLGNLWSSAPADGELNKYARYWVAYDYYMKAKAADPSLTEEADKLAAGVRRYFPEASEIFMFDMAKGDSYRASAGGMSALTTVKTK